MKKSILILLVLFSQTFYAQVKPVKKVSVINATTAFGENLPKTTEVTNVATGEIWKATAPILGTATLTTAAADFDLVNISALEGYSETGTISGNDLVVDLGDSTNNFIKIDRVNSDIVIDNENDGLGGITLDGATNMMYVDMLSGLMVNSFLRVAKDNTYAQYGTFNGSSLTGIRTYTLPDATGTVALTSDITGTNSGTNTGDQTSIVGITGTKAEFDTAVTDDNFAYQSDINPSLNIINTVTDFNDLVTAGTTGVWVVATTFTMTASKIIPTGVTLEFRDSQINLGGFTLTGTNTKINAEPKQIFDTNGSLTGTWDIVESYAEWFGAVGDGTTDDITPITKSLLLGKTRLLKKSYFTSKIDLNSGDELVGSGKETILKATNLCVTFGGIDAGSFTSSNSPVFKLASNPTIGDKSITMSTVSDANNYTVGEIIALWSVEGYTDGLSTFKPDFQQLTKVKSVNGTTGVVELYDVIYESYTGTGFRVSKGGDVSNSETTSVSSRFTKDIVFSDMSVSSTNDSWSRLGGTYNTVIRNINVIKSNGIFVNNGFAKSIVDNINGEFTVRGVDIAYFSHNSKIKIGSIYGVDNTSLGACITFAEGCRDTVIECTSFNGYSDGTTFYSSVIHFAQYSRRNSVINSNFSVFKSSSIIQGSNSFTGVINEGNSVVNSNFNFKETVNLIYAAGTSTLDTGVNIYGNLFIGETITTNTINLESSGFNIFNNEFKTPSNSIRITDSCSKAIISDNVFENTQTFTLGTNASYIFSSNIYGNNSIYNVVSSGNFGIDESNPTEKLDVNGFVKSSGFKTPTGTVTEFLKADGTVDTNTYLTNLSISDVNQTGVNFAERVLTDGGTLESLDAFNYDLSNVTTESLQLTPNAYKVSKLYGLEVNNALTGTLADFTFTRATTTTKVNSLGDIESVATNIPRIDYKNSSIGYLLLDKASTNLALQSETFDNASWVKQSTSQTSNVIVAPDGTLTADKIDDSSTSTSAKNVKQSFTKVASSLTYTFSVFAKHKEYSNLSVRIDDSAGNLAKASWNTELGTVTSSSVSGSGFSVDNTDIVPYNNGWYRLIVTITTNTATSLRLLIYINGFNSYTGVVGNGQYLWGAQLEQSAYASSYAPTTTTSVTTNADELNNAGSTAVINSQEGVLFIDAAALYNDGTTRTVSLSDGTAANVASISYNATSNQIQADYVVGSVSQASMTYTVTDVTVFHKIALRYATNDFSLWIDGVEQATDATGSVSAADTFTEWSFDDGAGANDFYGKIRSAKVFTTLLTDAEMTTLGTITDYTSKHLARTNANQYFEKDINVAGVAKVSGNKLLNWGDETVIIKSPTTSENVSVFFTNKAITVTEIRAVLQGTASQSLTWTLKHSIARDGSSTTNEIVTGGTATTSVKTGSDITTFNDATIPADSFVWLETTASAGTVNEVMITLFYTED